MRQQKAFDELWPMTHGISDVWEGKKCTIRAHHEIHICMENEENHNNMIALDNGALIVPNHVCRRFYFQLVG